MEVKNKTKVVLHKSLCERIHSVYEAKNKDYGDSFFPCAKSSPKLSSFAWAISTIVLKP